MSTNCKPLFFAIVAIVSLVAWPTYAGNFSWTPGNPDIVETGNSVVLTVDGVTATVQAFTAEINTAGTDADVIGPWPTIDGQFGLKVFGVDVRNLGVAANEQLGLIAQPGVGPPANGTDFFSGGLAPGFTSYSQCVPVCFPVLPPPAFHFAVFTFNQPVNVPAVTVDDVTNFPRGVWMATGTSAPDFAGGFLAGLSGFDIVNSADEPGTDGLQTHSLEEAGTGIRYLIVGAPPENNLGPLTGGSSQFFIDSFDAVALQPPVADAGPDQGVNEGDAVSLDGTASADSDGTVVSAEFLDDFESTNVTTVADFDLPGNPVPSNGIIATAAGGTAFTIGNFALYQSGFKSWMVEPAGTNARGTHTGSGTITFNVPMSRISFGVRSDPGITSTVTILDVNDNVAENSPITTVTSGAWTNVDFTITNGAAPLGSILYEVSGGAGLMAALDDLGGTSASDSGIASYLWTQTDASGINVTLTDADTATPSFTAPAVTADTTLTFSLVVTDNDGASSVADSVDITVNNVNEPAFKRCDTDDDSFVDINDIRTIILNRNQPATGPDDPMDWDQNGVINILDARGCQSVCTLPRCAVTQ